MALARLEPWHRIRSAALFVASLQVACASGAANGGGTSPAATSSATADAAQSPLHTMPDSVLALFGVPALRAVVLPDNDIDVRLSTGASMTFGATTLLRLTRTKGGAIGEVYVSWTSDTSTLQRRAEANLLAMPLLHDHGCVAPRRTGTSAACRWQFATRPDWTRVARILDSLDAFGLPSAEAMRAATRSRPITLTDEPDLRVTWRRGTVYSDAWYPAALSQPDAPGERLRALHALVSESRRWP